MTKVFVYGTLLQGEPNYHVMERSEGRLVGMAELQAKMEMLDLRAYPMLVKSEGTNIIEGEVYEVETLEHLDRLEGYPSFYDREQVRTSEGVAWVYYGKRASRYAHAPVIESGDWRQHLSEREKVPA
jgi:gamma-glutamylcyclotransferase (GGCT)/AIG2-like uncharacterized protein YtfP